MHATRQSIPRVLRRSGRLLALARWLRATPVGALYAELKLRLAGLILWLRPWVRSGAGVRLMVDPRDRRARSILLKRGAIDGDHLQLWRLLAFALEPDVIVDVGSNYGEVLFGCTYPESTEVVAIEADPRLAELLRRTTARRGGGVTVHHAAAGESSGVTTLYVDNVWSGRNSVVRPGTEDVSAINVPCATLDELLGAKPGASILVKIDVEGHEPAVIRGASELLSRSSVSVLLVEWSAGTASRLCETVIDAGGEMFLITRRDLQMVAVRGRHDFPDAATELHRHPFLRDVIVLFGTDQQRTATRRRLEVLTGRYGPRHRRHAIPSPVDAEP